MNYPPTTVHYFRLLSSPLFMDKIPLENLLARRNSRNYRRSGIMLSFSIASNSCKLLLSLIICLGIWQSRARHITTVCKIGFRDKSNDLCEIITDIRRCVSWLLRRFKCFLQYFFSFRYLWLYFQNPFDSSFLNNFWN